MRPCRRCGDISFYMREVTFKDGTVHVARYCNQFQHFLDYAAKEMPPGMFVMPYGKHKGVSLQAIFEKDRGYANWLCEHASPSIRKRMQTVMGEFAAERMDAFIEQSRQWVKASNL